MNEIELPKYLLKFTKEEYIEYFLNRGLYMNAAGYFAVKGYEDDSNQSDIYEGLSTFPYRELPKKEKTQAERYQEAKTDFDRLCASAPIIGYNVYKGRRRPVWCCTGVDENDVVNGQFKISKKVLKDFFQEQTTNACAVLIDCKKFMNLIFENHKPDDYTLTYGYVDYNDLHKCYGDFSDSGVWYDSIFIKKIELSYQKEFRIAVCGNCEENLKKKVIDHFEVEVLDKDNPYVPYKYKLENIDSTKIKVYRMDDVLSDDEFLYFEIK